VGKKTQNEKETMKKLIFTSMLTAVGLIAQSSTPAPAAPQKNNAAPASQTPATTQHKKHKKTKPSGTANSNAAPASSSSSTPVAPAKK